MKKFNAERSDLHDADEMCGGVDVYIASEVDAEIAGLRQAHREDVKILRDDLARVQQALRTTSDALSQLSVTCSMLRQQNERLMNRSE